jgi:hypothetical protein
MVKGSRNLGTILDLRRSCACNLGVEKHVVKSESPL